MSVLPAWLKPRSATSAEIDQQLGGARAAHQKAQLATAEAQRAFDATGADAELKQLTKAREAEAAAAEFVGRAERLHTEAKLHEAAAARTALEEQRHALETQLAPDVLAELRAPGAAAELQALIAAARAHAERIEVEIEIGGRHRALARLCEQLGDEAGARFHAAAASYQPPDQRSVARGLITLQSTFERDALVQAQIDRLIAVAGGRPYVAPAPMTPSHPTLHVRDYGVES